MEMDDLKITLSLSDARTIERLLEQYEGLTVTQAVAVGRFRTQIQECVRPLANAAVDDILAELAKRLAKLDDAIKATAP